MKVYISIPITGKDIDEQRKHAGDVASFLLTAGHTPVSPFNNGLDVNASYEEHMRADIKMLLDCDAIIMCRDFLMSFGCRFECDVANKCGLTVVDEYMPASVIIDKLKVVKKVNPPYCSSCKDFDKSNGYCNNFGMVTSENFYCRFYQREV